MTFPSTRRYARLPFQLCFLAVISGLTACKPAVSSHPAETGVIAGVVMGGQQPVTASSIQLYAVGTATDGGASTPLLTAVVTTSDGTGQANANANASNNNNALPAGAFDIPALNCPAGDALVYLSASGGNPGLTSPANNQQLQLLAALGSCQQLRANFQSGAVTMLSINELTTVGAIAALYPYTSGYNAIGSTPGHAAALAAAFNVANEYVNFQTGQAPGPALPAGYSASTPDVNDLGDVLATCVNSAGGVAGDGTDCGKLFTDTTPAATNIAPTDTVGAMLDIRLNPTSNVSTIFYLAQPQAPFEPVNANPPADFTLPISNSTPAPSFSVPGGSYTNAQSVAITDTDAGATIYYTTDGTMPSTSSTVYTSPIAVNTPETLQAIAVDQGISSSTASATYSGKLALSGATFSLNSLSVPADSTAPVTLTASEESSSPTNGSVVTFYMDSSVGGSLSSNTCTIQNSTCSVSYLPSGSLTAGNYSDVFYAIFTSDGVHQGGEAISSLTITAAPFGTTATATVLNNFTDASGATPGMVDEENVVPLIQGSDGSFYGTARFGGSSYFGVVFKVDSTGSYTLLHTFTGVDGDGNSPTSALIEGSDGNFYGTTVFGDDQGNGIVYRINSTGTSFKELHSFISADDGIGPAGKLVQGADGALYGTTTSGGAYGYGTLYRIDAAGSFSVLHDFAGQPTDGLFAYELTQGSDGNLYGVTGAGGQYDNGTVFRIDPTGSSYTVLHSFASATEGSAPGAHLIQGPDGNFYGTTPLGGPNGKGTVFSISPAGVFQVLHAFPATSTDGSTPSGGLVQGSDGNLYGSLFSLPNSFGTVFEISTTGDRYSVLLGPGTQPSGSQFIPSPLVQGSDGIFYGLASGGTSNNGLIFRLNTTPALAGPIALTVPANVTHGGTFTLSYAVANAGPTAGVTATGPSTLQNCFATNNAGDTTGWTGSITGSPTAQNVSLTAPGTAGSYRYSLTCGGMESGVATLVVQ